MMGTKARIMEGMSSDRDRGIGGKGGKEETILQQ